MKVKELKELAKEQGIKGYYKMKKEELLKLVKFKDDSPLSSPEPVEEEKEEEKFIIQLKSHAGNSSFVVKGAETLREALLVFMKVKRENTEYNIIELKMNGILVRREKITKHN